MMNHLQHSMYRGELHQLGGKTVTWYGNDLESIYNPVTQAGPNLYLPTDFGYTFNSHAFRCDEFSDPTDLSIVFVGCSITEGIGLPIEVTWPYRVVEAVRNFTGKKIPFWNLAKYGSGVDTAAYNLFFYGPLLSAPPKLIIGLNPPLHRRETYLGEPVRKVWNNPSRLRRRTLPASLDPIFSDEWFCAYQAMRSFMIIDLLAKQWGSKVFFANWYGEMDFSHKEDPGKVKWLYEQFPHFNIVSEKGLYGPTTMARDGIHQGPDKHAALAIDFWDAIKEHVI